MFTRSVPLLGIEGLTKLNNSHVAVFGLGGVGGNTVEALARAGVMELSIFDFDTVNETNKNRQIIALESTIGKSKVEVMKSRLLDINPDIKVNAYDIKVDEKVLNTLDFSIFDYVADCIDDVNGKLAIIKKSKENDIKIISSCGTGNKLDPMKFMIKDINQTSVCPLAKKIRLELRRLDIKGVDVLFSTEEPVSSPEFISSVSFVPSIAGILIARHIISNIVKE
jgi:tRNA A37 threonylcarbamoyladenosine dehydratase